MTDSEISRDQDLKSPPSITDKADFTTMDVLAENVEQNNAVYDKQLPNKATAAISPSVTLQNTRLANFNDSHLGNMFGVVPEKGIIFCIDTSGSMFNALDVVKEHLMEKLSSLAILENHVMFNLIEFNSQVTQWSDKLVQCTPETVCVARQWVNNLSAKTGTNTQGALFAALADPACQAVYLVTDDIPDQYTGEVLDNIISTCGSRRIHCIYITSGVPDEKTTEFLEDLAVETYGSLTIVKLLSNGKIEKLIPVYFSEPSYEKLVWTVNNTLRPNIKTCSVATTLQLDPDEVLGSHPFDGPKLFYPHPTAAPLSLLGTYADCYYYPYYWSRFHPATAWLKAQDKLREPLFGLSYEAGSLLIGKKVIARRLEDGYFYSGTIQSHNFGTSFLVSFGPCKHGRYQQTEYEDVFIFDIVDYTEALRHTIVTGDNVLAPWEPAGERFAPGIVIDGQEMRQEDGPENKELTVCFGNGNTVGIPHNVAVWIPPAMYDRLSLELQMSASTRKCIFSTLRNYPNENLPGYPKLEYPAEYFRPPPLTIESKPYLWDPAFYCYPHCYPAPYVHPPFTIKPKEEKERKSPFNVTTSDDDSALIPNTGMTKQELEQRVMLQLMEHRCDNGNISEAKLSGGMPDDSRQNTSIMSSRILEKREKREENILNKHVHFTTKERTEKPTEANCKYLDDEDYDDYGNIIRKMDSAVNTDSSLLFYSSPGIRQRPAWRKYWHHDPSPPLSAARYGLGGTRKLSCAQSFREMGLQAPLEARQQINSPYIAEWPNSVFKYVDTFAKHDHSSSVRECLSAPSLSSKENVHANIHSYIPGSQPTAKLTYEEREEIRRANRHRRVLKRETEWQERLKEENNMRALMQDNHRGRILDQLERDRQRQIQEQENIHRVREAKKKINADLRTRIEENQKDEAEKEAMRIAALVKRRERRVQIQTQREKEIQECVERREQIRKQNNEARVKETIERLDEKAVEAAKLEKQHQKAHLQRLHHFQKLEKESRKKKDLRIAVAEQHQALNRSQIFS